MTARVNDRAIAHNTYEEEYAAVNAKIAARETLTPSRFA
jgi:hypothetical protein